MIPISIRSVFTLAVPAVGLAAFISVHAAHGTQSDRPQKRRVAVRGRLMGTPDSQQVITWQTESPSYGSRRHLQAHLAIETAGPDRRTLWQIDGSDLYHQVDSIRLADLDGDGVPEITSL